MIQLTKSDVQKTYTYKRSHKSRVDIQA